MAFGIDSPPRDIAVVPKRNLTFNSIDFLAHFASNPFVGRGVTEENPIRRFLLGPIVVLLSTGHWQFSIARAVTSVLLKNRRSLQPAILRWAEMECVGHRVRIAERVGLSRAECEWTNRTSKSYFDTVLVPPQPVRRTDAFPFDWRRVGLQLDLYQRRRPERLVRSPARVNLGRNSGEGRRQGRSRAARFIRV